MHFVVLSFQGVFATVYSVCYMYTYANYDDTDTDIDTPDEKPDSVQA